MPTSPPRALKYSAENCTIGRTMVILGDRWSFVVCREIVNGIRRFEDMRVRTGIPKQVLTDRLRLLMDHGILRKEPYQVPGERLRHEYRLTAKGFDLYPILVSIAGFGDRHLADPEGTAVEFEHRDCGELVHAQLRCDAGHDIDDPRDVQTRPGPGVRLREAS